MGMSNNRNRAARGIAAVAAVALLPLTAMSASAATSTVSLSAGSLSIGTLSNTTLASTPVTTGTVSGAVNSGNWADTTGTGLGWHGTIALTGSPFVDQGAWAPTGGGAPVLTTTTSGAYTGTVGNALLTVTVSSGATSLNTPFNWSDREGGTTTGSVTTCANGSACTVASGVTITFASGVTYAASYVYTAKVGAMPVTATVIATASATAVAPVGTTVGGTNLPTYEANTSVVSAASAGTAVAFVTAALNSGMGTFTVAPGITVTWDPNNTWDAGYTATGQ